MSELQLLAEAIGANERTLRRAVNQGTLRGERTTPRKLRIPAAEKRYLHRRWPLLAALRSALRTEPNVQFALLFGSAARGDDRPTSDLDLLVRLRDPSLARILDLEERLERETQRSVDVITLAAAEGNSLLLATAVDEGRVLVDRIDLWSELSAESTALDRRARQDGRRQAQQALAGIDLLLGRRVAR